MAAAAALVLACSRPAGLPQRRIDPPPALELALERVLLLGADASGPAESLFARIRGVRTDVRDQIYIADVGAMAIRVYDRAGNYLRSVGGRGREPGRFLDITSFDVTPDGEVIVADGIALRVSTFAADGSFVSTAYYDERSLLWPRHLRSVSPVCYLLLCKMPRIMPDGHRRADADYLFHVFDRQMAKISAFGRLEELTGTEETVVQVFNELYPGRLWLETDGTILYAPSLYRGEVFRYQQSDGAWQRAGALAGYAPAPAFIDLGSETSRRGPLVFRMRTREGLVVAEVRNASLGVFRLRDERIVHFTLITQGEDRVLGAEIFNHHGGLLGYGILDELRSWDQEVAFFPVTVEWKDQDDRFYLVDARIGPVVQVVRLRIPDLVR